MTTDVISPDIVVTGNTVAAGIAAIQARRKIHVAEGRLMRVLWLPGTKLAAYPYGTNINVWDTGYHSGEFLGGGRYELRKEVSSRAFGISGTFARANSWLSAKAMRDMTNRAGVWVYNKGQLTTPAINGGTKALEGMTLSDGQVVACTGSWIDGDIDGLLASLHPDIAANLKKQRAAADADNMLGGVRPNIDQFTAFYHDDGTNYTLAEVEAVIGVIPNPGGLVFGQADTGDTYQAMTLRLSCTDDRSNRAAWPEPAGGVDLALIEFLRRTNDIENPSWLPFGVSGNIPYCKVDVNGDYSHPWHLEWPSATPARRAELYGYLRDRMMGWFYWLTQNGPTHVKVFLSLWRPCNDEYTGTDHFPPEPYRRSSPSIAGYETVTQAIIQAGVPMARPAGITPYSIDEHIRRYLSYTHPVSGLNGVITDGIHGTPYVNSNGLKSDSRWTTPTPIGAYTMITADCPNYIGLYSHSATTVAQAATRIDDFVNQLGFYAGTWAPKALNDGVSLYGTNFTQLKAEVEADGGILEYHGTSPPFVPTPDPPDEEEP